MTLNNSTLKWGIPTIIILLISVLSVLLLQSFNDYKSEADLDYQRAFTSNYRILSPYIPQKVDFAGETVPADLFYIREALEREILVNTFWQSNTLLMIKRAWRYFPVIEPILKENNIPDDFKYLALIESGFDNVVSPAGAAGFWQFLKSTAKSYNLEITEEVDERYNLEKATDAACKYFKESNRKFNNWTMTAAAYNMGNTGLSNQVNIQKSQYYYYLNLNSETARYVYRIIAFKLIISEPTKYGFYLRKNELYQPLKTQKYIVDSTIADLGNFALKMNVNYKLLKLFNPWLRKNSLTNKNKKKYEIILPDKNFINYSKIIEPFYNNDLIWGDTIKVNQIK